MPGLRRYPARRGRRELERRPFDLAAGEDAVAGAEVLIELGVGDLLGARLEQARLADRIDREAAQVGPEVAPAIQVPVVAVMHQALRRHLALGLLVVLAVVVADPEL